MKRIITERRTRTDVDQMIKISDELVRDFAEFSGYMMNDELTKKNRHWTRITENQKQNQKTSTEKEVYQG